VIVLKMSQVDKSLDELIGKDKKDRKSARGGKPQNKPQQRGGAVRNSDRKSNQSTYTVNKSSRGGGGNRGGSSRGGGRGGRRETRNLNDQWTHSAYLDQDEAPQRDANEIFGYKARISGLKFDVLEDELKDLFGRCGMLHSVKIIYDKTGRSSGVGEAVFAKHGDQQRAIAQYQDKKIDGEPITVVDAGMVNIGTKAPRSKPIVVEDDERPVRRNNTNASTNAPRGNQATGRPAQRRQQWEDEDLNVDNVNFKISVDYS